MKVGPSPMRACEGRCNHYTGIYGPGMKKHETCDAGVNYRELVGGEGIGWAARLPCVTTSLSKNVVDCVKRELPTAEQVATYDAWSEKHFVIIREAMSRCREHAKGKRGVQGAIECPECGGKLHYSIAGSNGHLWGRCETAECLSWMQ